jgi:hypothetical protein
VQAFPNSPAAAQGIPADDSAVLVSMNGENMRPKEGQLPKIPASFHSIPLHLVLADDSGKTKHVTLTRKGAYTTGTLMGKPEPLPADKRVALLYQSGTSSFAVVESIARPETVMHYDGVWSTNVADKKITCYGAKNHPDASFIVRNVNIDIANDFGKLSQSQIEQLAAGV